MIKIFKLLIQFNFYKNKKVDKKKNYKNAKKTQEYLAINNSFLELCL